MSDEIEVFQTDLEKSVEAHRKQAVTKITLESERLIEELLKIIYSDDLDLEGRPIVDAKVKLSAISMLLDRGIPKLAVDNTKSEVVEESRTRKRIRDEIEVLVRGDKKMVEQET